MMNLLIFKYSRRLPQSLRNILICLFPYYLKIKHLIQYGTVNIFETVNIETNSDCNRKCSYCPNSLFKQKKYLLPLSQLKSIAVQLAKLHYKGTIAFTGHNEPLLDKRIVEIIKIMREHLNGNEIIIYTNGDLLTAGLLKDLKQYSTVFNVTCHDQKAFKKFWERAKAFPTRQKLKINIKSNIKGDVLSTRGGLVAVQNPQRQPCCIIPCSEVTIDARGNMLLCPDDYRKEHIFGSVKQTMIKELWLQEKYQKIKDQLRGGRAELPICRACIKK